MPLIYADRVQETVTVSAGTGSVTFAGAVTNFQTFVSGIGAGNQCAYTITGAAGHEVGLGTVSALGLTREVVLYSSQGSAGGFSKTNFAGSLIVFNTLPAVFANGSLVVTTSAAALPGAKLLQGTTRQVTVSASQVALASAVIFPGQVGIRLPAGVTADVTAGDQAAGLLRYNTFTDQLEGYASAAGMGAAKNHLMPRALVNPDRAILRDDFIFNFALGQVSAQMCAGELGWSFSSTSAGNTQCSAGVTAAATHPGILELRTPATAGSTIFMFNNKPETISHQTNFMDYMCWILQLAIVTSVSFFAGLHNDASALPTVGSHVGWLVSAGVDPPNMLVFRAADGGGQIAVSANMTELSANQWYKLECFLMDDKITWVPVVTIASAAGTKVVGASASTTAGIGNQLFCVVIQNSAQASRSVGIDYFAYYTKPVR